MKKGESRGARWWSFRFPPVEPRTGDQPLDTIRLGCTEHEAEFVRWVHLKTHVHGWKRVTRHYDCSRTSWNRLRRYMLRTLVQS